MKLLSANEKGFEKHVFQKKTILTIFVLACLALLLVSCRPGGEAVTGIRNWYPVATLHAAVGMINEDSPIIDQTRGINIRMTSQQRMNFYGATGVNPLCGATAVSQCRIPWAAVRTWGETQGLIALEAPEEEAPVATIHDIAGDDHLFTLTLVQNTALLNFQLPDGTTKTYDVALMNIYYDDTLGSDVVKLIVNGQDVPLTKESSGVIADGTRITLAGVNTQEGWAQLLFELAGAPGVGETVYPATLNDATIRTVDANGNVFDYRVFLVGNALQVTKVTTGTPVGPINVEAFSWVTTDAAGEQREFKGKLVNNQFEFVRIIR